MTAHNVLSAIADLRRGRVALSPEQQLRFLDAVEEVTRVLIDAPRDSLQSAIWHTHERAPALARLADAARPGQPSLAEEVEAARLDDVRVVRELRAHWEQAAEQQPGEGQGLGSGL